MIYEKFAESMQSKDRGMTRKFIRDFTIKYALLLFISALLISTVILNIVGAVFSVIFLILILFFYVWSFDILVESDKHFKMVSRVANLWWLIDILIFISCFLLNKFIV